MQVEKLVAKFNNYQMTGQNGPTLEEAQFLCENEEHDIFFFDSYTYRDILDYRDYLVDSEEYSV